MRTRLRIARPVSDLLRAETMYCQGLGLKVLDGFRDHQGFDGVMLGEPGLEYHLEFTVCRHHPVAPSPGAEDLLVFYLPDAGAWRAACTRMREAGFVEVPSFNPYWDLQGRTFQDPDGYRTVLQQAEWTA